MIQGHKQSGLVTLVERRSGYLLAARLPRISAELTQAAMIRLLKPRRGAVQTITLDNGSKYAGYEAVAKAVMAAMYFWDPYFSGQRVTNEKTNGLIRQVLRLLLEFRGIIIVDDFILARVKASIALCARICLLLESEGT